MMLTRSSDRSYTVTDMIYGLFSQLSFVRNVINLTSCVICQELYQHLFDFILLKKLPKMKCTIKILLNLHIFSTWAVIGSITSAACTTWYNTNVRILGFHLISTNWFQILCNHLECTISLYKLCTVHCTIISVILIWKYTSKFKLCNWLFVQNVVVPYLIEYHYYLVSCTLNYHYAFSRLSLH